MAEKAKHTPGPWSVHGGLRGYKGDVFVPTEKSIKDCHHIARCFAPKPVKGPIDELRVMGAEHDAIMIIEANALLIAAAPDLLEALKVCASLIRIQNGNLHQDTNAILEMAKLAVDKAEGR